MRNITAIVRTGRDKRNRGFTLVELLVVIAIIGILASIVIPNVAENIRKGQITKAVSEVRGIDTAITSMLSDVQRSNFRNWFVKGSDPDIL
ncbi:MAG: prepilin-type N-terminal cleavage/methylation domain-containing protein, partial [Candidatus Hydrogenedentota bacterium]